MLELPFLLLSMEHRTSRHISQEHYWEALCGKPPDRHNPLTRKVHLYSLWIRKGPVNIVF